MTIRQGTTRQSHATATSANSRQLNNRSATIAAKAADIDQFNAAINAKRQGESKTGSGDEQSSVCSTDTRAEQNIHSGMFLHAVASPIGSGVTLLHSGYEISVSTEGHSQNNMGKHIACLKLSAQTSLSACVEQAVNVIQRIFNSAGRTQELRSWRLEVLLSDEETLTIQLDYLGKTDWSIGLPRDRDAADSGNDEIAYDERGFVAELQSRLRQSNPKLRISTHIQAPV